MKISSRYGSDTSSIRHHVFFLYIFLSTYGLSFSQTVSPQIIKSSAQCYSEELFIKTDRDLYISGEKVWLKIYTINSLTHTPENISKVVYVEVLDAENNPVNQLKVAIEGFTGSGFFNLPDTLSTGNYFIRSFTNWMQNFSEDLFTYKKISVINPFKINEIKIPAVNRGADSIIFSPEGGNLIPGIEGRLGIKSINKDGGPVSIIGAVINGKNDTLSLIQTGEDGYGWTTINPSDQNSLYLVTRAKNGRTRKFQIPGFRHNGISLSVPLKSEKTSSLIRIKASPDFAAADSSIFLMINSAGMAGLKKKISMHKDSELTLSRKDLPSGLSHIIIVDGHDTRLSERWIYNETSQPLNFKIIIPKNSYASREKIEMTITAADDNGNPVESDFSISVAKTVTVSRNNFESSKVRQLPDLTISDYNKHLPDINDYLMFYNARDLISSPAGKSQEGDPLYLPELEGHLISGNIKYRKTGAPVGKENVSLSFVGKSALCQFAKTNERGEFHFKTSEHGMREIVIQPLSDKITDYYVELNNPFTQATKKYSHVPFIPDTSRLADINNVIISTQISSIYGPYTQESEKNSVNKPERDFYGKPDNTILLSEFIELTSLKEVVKEIIPGVNTVKKNDKVNFRLFYQYQSQPFENNPLVLVDGVPVYDLEKVIAINSKDLEKIDVFTTRYYISDIIMDGILHFVTKKGNLDVIDLDRSVYRVEYELPEDHNEFYSPDYSNTELLNNRIPDFRNTLYWNPVMHTRKDGKAAVEFYSSDESGEYTITVEGITTDGKTGSVKMPLIIKSK